MRSLVDAQIDDQNIGVFAEQVLTAKSWYKGVDANAAEQIMKEMIDEAITDQDRLESIINVGANKVQQTVSSK